MSNGSSLHSLCTLSLTISALEHSGEVVSNTGGCKWECAKSVLENPLECSSTNLYDVNRLASLIAAPNPVG